MKKLFTLLFLTAFTLVGYAYSVASGECGGEGDGSNLKWKLVYDTTPDIDGTLTISGIGKMKDCSSGVLGRVVAL